MSLVVQLLLLELALLQLDSSESLNLASSLGAWRPALKHSLEMLRQVLFSPN
jgi:hypothetical protein